MKDFQKRFDEIHSAVVNDRAYKSLNCSTINEIQTYRVLTNLKKDFNLSLISKDELKLMFNCLKKTFIEEGQKSNKSYEVYKQQQEIINKISGLTKEILKAADNQDKEKVFDLLLEMFGKCQDEVSCKLIKERLQKS